VTRLLVHAADAVGTEMSSSGIRSYELARALAHEFDVTLMAPGDLRGLDATFELRPPSSKTRDFLAFGAVIAQTLPPDVMRALARADVNLVFDLYIPVLHEALASAAVEPTWRSRAYARAAATQQRLALRTGSAFVCASERQRELLLDALAGLGRISSDAPRDDPSLRDLIDVVPFGLREDFPDGLPASLPGVGPGDRVLLWAGGIANWFDPLTPIRAMAEIAGSRADVKLVFLSLSPPRGAPTAMAVQAVELAESLGLLGRNVFFNEHWVPYTERHRYLVAADIGISAHFQGLESRYAFRTRLLDHFWAGLPTITSSGDVLGELVRDRALGVVVEPGDVAGWVAAMRELLDETVRQRVRANVAAIRPELTWSRAVEPLVRLLRRPGSPIHVPLPDRARSAAARAQVAIMLRTGRLARGRRTVW